MQRPEAAGLRAGGTGRLEKRGRAPGTRWLLDVLDIDGIGQRGVELGVGTGVHRALPTITLFAYPEISTQDSRTDGYWYLPLDGFGGPDTTTDDTERSRSYKRQVWEVGGGE